PLARAELRLREDLLVEVVALREMLQSPFEVALGGLRPPVQLFDPVPHRLALPVAPLVLLLLLLRVGLGGRGLLGDHLLELGDRLLRLLALSEIEPRGAQRAKAADPVVLRLDRRERR